MTDEHKLSQPLPDDAYDLQAILCPLRIVADFLPSGKFVGGVHTAKLLEVSRLGTRLSELNFGDIEPTIKAMDFMLQTKKHTEVEKCMPIHREITTICEEAETSVVEMLQTRLTTDSISALPVASDDIVACVREDGTINEKASEKIIMLNLTNALPAYDTIVGAAQVPRSDRISSVAVGWWTITF